MRPLESARQYPTFIHADRQTNHATRATCNTAVYRVAIPASSTTCGAGDASQNTRHNRFIGIRTVSDK